jgi:UDP-glucose 4-epimerase
MVYGAQPTNSAFLREAHALQGSKGYGYIRDLVEVEAFCNGFQRQMPDIVMTILRFAHIVGPKADTPMTRFLKDEESLVLLGFDPMMQVIHEADVARALVHSVLHDAPGVFNVAADGFVPLWKLMGLAGKIALPVLHPAAYMSVQLLGPRYAPMDVDYLRYPCVGDCEKMKSELRFTPHYTAEEALREFATQNRLRRYMPEALSREQEEERLRDTLERRRRARQAAAKKEKAPRKRKALKTASRAAAKRATPRARRTLAEQPAAQAEMS